MMVICTLYIQKALVTHSNMRNSTLMKYMSRKCVHYIKSCRHVKQIIHRTEDLS